MELLQGPDGTTERWIADVLLEGVRYFLVYTWNELLQAWYLEVDDAAGEILVAGVRLICRWPLLNLHTRSRPGLPQGMLLVRAVGEDLSDPGRLEFRDGGRCVLTYLTLEECAEIWRQGAGQLDGGVRVQVLKKNVWRISGLAPGSAGNTITLTVLGEEVVFTSATGAETPAAIVDAFTVGLDALFLDVVAFDEGDTLLLTGQNKGEALGVGVAVTGSATATPTQVTPSRVG